MGSGLRLRYPGRMIKVAYDAPHKTITLAFEGTIDGRQAERSNDELAEILKDTPRGFRVLSDLSAVDSMEIEVEAEMIKAMDMLNKAGAAEVVGVLPDPDLDIGFNIMTREHYSKDVRVQIVRSRDEALARVNGRK